MLSPGKHHERVPRGQKENRRYRRALLRRARGDFGFQQAVLDRCAADCSFWVSSFVFQFNPNSIGTSSPELGPFITWEYQDEVLEALEGAIRERHDLLLEKSREMGASWLCLLKFAQRFLFQRNQKFLVISRSADAVDKPGDPDSLFWKLDFIFEHLPSWMTRGRIARSRFVFRNPLLLSTVTGEASTGRAGVGGRATAIFIDEFSQIHEDREVLSRTSDTSGCRIFNGTHLGLDTAFYSLSQRPDMRKLVLHWSSHPDKRRGLYRFNAEKQCVEVLDADYEFPDDYMFVTDGSPTGGPCPGIRSPWYDKQCRRKSDSRHVAMDLDINPQGSVSQFFDPLMILRLKEKSWEPLWEGDIDYDRDTGEPFGLTPAPGGPLKLWVNPVYDPSSRTWKVSRGKYVGAADVANGQGATPSCLTIGRVATGDKVAAYVDPFIFPERFGVKAVALARLFCDPDGVGMFLGWEQQGPGGVFGKVVLDTGYRAVYYKADDFDMRVQVSEKPGWYPSPPAKRLLLEEYRADLYNGRFTNPCVHAIEECLAFKYDGRGRVVNSKEDAEDDPSGARENHADRVIADALCAKLLRERGGGRSIPSKREESKPLTVLSLAGREQLLRERAALEEVWG